MTAVTTRTLAGVVAWNGFRNWLARLWSKFRSGSTILSAQDRMPRQLGREPSNPSEMDYQEERVTDSAYCPNGQSKERWARRSDVPRRSAPTGGLVRCRAALRGELSPLRLSR